MVMLVLGIMFSTVSMLLLNATLRDILMFRMKGFCSSDILFILSDTLILLFITVRRRLNKRKAAYVELGETYAGVSTV